MSCQSSVICRVSHHLSFYHQVGHTSTCMLPADFYRIGSAGAWRFRCVTACAHRKACAHTGKIAAPARRLERSVAEDTKGNGQAGDGGGSKRTAGEAGLGMPSSSIGREEHDHTEQRHASQDGSDGPTPKRARVEAPDTPAEGGTARLALPAPQVREPISSSAAPQAPELRSNAAASEVDLQAAQQVISNILLDCRQSEGLS